MSWDVLSFCGPAMRMYSSETKRLPLAKLCSNTEYNPHACNIQRAIARGCRWPAERDKHSTVAYRLGNGMWLARDVTQRSEDATHSRGLQYSRSDRHSSLQPERDGAQHNDTASLRHVHSWTIFRSSEKGSRMYRTLKNNDRRWMVSTCVAEEITSGQHAAACNKTQRRDLPAKEGYLDSRLPRWSRM